MVEELHYEGVDGKPKATQESRLIKTHLPRGKRARLFSLARETNPGLVRKLKPISNPIKGLLV